MNKHFLGDNLGVMEIFFLSNTLKVITKFYYVIS